MSEPNALLGPNSPTGTGSAAASEILSAERAPKVSLFKRLLKNPVGLAADDRADRHRAGSIFAPLFTSSDPNQASLKDFLGPSSAGHMLGFDSAGRDVWARLLYAGRYSLAGAILALGIAAVIGITGGLVAGYYGGWFDSVASWLAGLVMAMPGLVLLLAARAVIGPSLWWSMSIFGVLLAPAFYRLVYASVTAVRNELYVDAARVAGLSDSQIIGRHILTVVRAPVIIQSAMILGIALAIQAGLDFLGLGDTTIPTWGTMLQEGFNNIYEHPELVLWPALALGFTTLSLTLLANTMQDVLKRSSRPRRSARRGRLIGSTRARSRRSCMRTTTGRSIGWARCCSKSRTSVWDTSSRAGNRTRSWCMTSI